MCFCAPMSPMLIGVKRNAERYKFSEPRAPVDAVWARTRESRFSFRKAEAVVNFLVTFAQKAFFAAKGHDSGQFFAFWAQRPILEPTTHFWAGVCVWVKKSCTSIQIPLIS